MKIKGLLILGAASVILQFCIGCNPSTSSVTSVKSPNSSSNASTIQSNSDSSTSGGQKSTLPDSTMVASGGSKGEPPKQTQKTSQDPPIESKRLFDLKHLKSLTLTANGSPLHLWIMDTPDKREEGMMYLLDKDVANNQGMIFVFPAPALQSFWMQNTYIPLDIIYLSADATILNSVPAKKLDTTPLPSKGEAKYVIEVKLGQGKPHGLVPGVKVHLPASLVTLQ